jgi:hypothetical protein
MYAQSPTFRLFRKHPSFSDGMASLVDLSNNQSRYNYDKNEIEADINSLHSDWVAVGDDLRGVIKKYDESKQQAKFARQ